MEIHNPTSKKVNEGIAIEFYSLPLPNIKDFEFVNDYNENFKSWQASKQILMVHKNSETELRRILFNTKDYGGAIAFEQALEKGISIESIKQRLELYFCDECAKFCKSSCKYCKGAHNKIILKPAVEVKAETDTTPNQPTIEFSELKDKYKTLMDAYKTSCDQFADMAKNILDLKDELSSAKKENEELKSNNEVLKSVHDLIRKALNLVKGDDVIFKINDLQSELTSVKEQLSFKDEKIKRLE